MDVQLMKECFQIYKEGMEVVKTILNGQHALGQEFMSLITRVIQGMEDAFKRYEDSVTNLKETQRIEVLRLQRVLEAKDSEIHSLKLKLIDEVNMFSEKTQKELESQVTDFLSTDQKICFDSDASISKDEIQGKIGQMLDQLHYSGAQGSLNEVFTILNIYKKFGQEVPIETSVMGDHQEILETNNIILRQLTNDLAGKFKQTQLQTAKRIMHRFFKKPETHDQEIETESEEQVNDLLRYTINTKEGVIKQLREDILGQQNV